MEKTRRGQAALRQVLVLYGESLLAQGIESLLRKEKNLVVLGLQVGSGPQGLRYPGFDPDAIVLDACDLGRQTSLSVLGLLQEFPRAKVICLSAQDERLEVFHKDQYTVARREELVKAISRDGPGKKGR